MLKFKPQTHASAYNHKSKIHDKGRSQYNQKKTREINMLLKTMQWVKQDSWAIRKNLENN